MNVSITDTRFVLLSVLSGVESVPVLMSSGLSLVSYMMSKFPHVLCTLHASLLPHLMAFWSCISLPGAALDLVKMSTGCRAGLNYLLMNVLWSAILSGGGPAFVLIK